MVLLQFKLAMILLLKYTYSSTFHEIWCRIWNTCKCSIRHLIQSGSLNSEAILFPLSWWLGIELEGCQPWKAFCRTKSIHIYFLLVHAECSAIQLCLALWDPMDYSPTGSSVNEISQARILEWVAVSLSRSSLLRGQTHITCIGRWILYYCATLEAPFSSSTFV